EWPCQHLSAGRKESRGRTAPLENERSNARRRSRTSSLSQRLVTQRPVYLIRVARPEELFAGPMDPARRPRGSGRRAQARAVSPDALFKKSGAILAGRPLGSIWHGRARNDPDLRTIVSCRKRQVSDLDGR